MIWTQGQRACTHDLGSSAPFLRAPVANCLVSRVWVQTLYPSLCLMSSLPAWTRPSWTLICVLLSQLTTWAPFCLGCAGPHCFPVSPSLAVRIPGVSALHLCSGSSPGLSTYCTPDEVWSALHGMSHMILRATFFEISSITVNFMDMENELQEMTKFTQQVNGGGLKSKWRDDPWPSTTCSAGLCWQ